MIEGGRVPTSIMFNIWAESIGTMKKEIDDSGVIIDGSPRSLIEAKLIDNIFKWYEWKDVKIILLDISREEAFNRLTKRRICKKCGQLIPWVGDFKNIKKCDKCFIKYICKGICPALNAVSNGNDVPDQYSCYIRKRNSSRDYS